MVISHPNQRRTKVIALITGLACCASITEADGPGRSFTSFTSPFTQELIAVTESPVGADGFMGGVAFAPDGDVWAAECASALLHRFDRQGAGTDGHGGIVRPESLVDLSTYAPAPEGCGLVNHPDLYLGLETMFANTPSGLWPLEAATGIPILGGPLNSASINAGNGRGIDVDPASLPTNHIVYTGADCDPAMRPTAVACTLWDYDMTAGATLAFARFHRAPGESIESLYFVPDGSKAFVSYRDGETGEQGLLVIARPAVLISNRNTIDDSQIVERVVMEAMPQGMAFRAAGDFALALNEDGTMTRLTFPSENFGGTPARSTFAAGGFRGGLLRVGADGCIYAPQGRLPGGTSGVRYGDDALGESDSIVRICGGFVPSPGVAGGDWSTTPGSISGSAFADWNRNGTRDGAEPGLPAVPISMTGPAAAVTQTDSAGEFFLGNLEDGLYSLSAPVSFGILSGRTTHFPVNLGSGEQRTGVDFPYIESTAPTCGVAPPSGTPARLTLTLNDASGIRRVVVRTLANFQASFGGAPITVPGAFDWPAPVTGNLTITATRLNDALPALVGIDAMDAFGNVVTCSGSAAAGAGPKPTPPRPEPPPEPVPTTIRKELTGWGRFDVEIAKNVASSMRYVTIRNARQGLQHVEVYVNQRWFFTGALRDSQVKQLDIGKALVRGEKNRIVLVGRGRSHDRAVVTISSQR